MKEEFDRLIAKAEKIRQENQDKMNDALADGLYTLLLHYDNKVMVHIHGLDKEVFFDKDVTIEEIIQKIKDIK